MKNLLYNALKIALSVVVSIFIAELVGLSYATTAGVIAMLGILDNRKQTIIVGLKRILTATIAIIIVTILFELGGHNLITVGIFMLVFVPLVTLLKSSEGLAISTVLIMHIYTIKNISFSIAVNEMGLLIIGILVAWTLNIHMPKIEDGIKDLQNQTEKQIKLILSKMALQLNNQCSLEEPQNLLVTLDELITQGLNSAIRYNNNYILKENCYYIYYFQMRREQFQVLVHMENHFNTIFINEDKAMPLITYTKKLESEFGEGNNGEKLLNEAKELLNFYRNAPLPTSREEFENRSTLFQYFNDLIYFVEIKARFMKLWK